MFLKLTDAFRKHVREVFGLPADAGDEAITKTALEKIKSGELTFDKLTELTAEPKPDAKAAVQTLVEKQVQAAINPLSESLKGLTDLLQKHLTKQPEPPAEKAATPPVQNQPNPHEVMLAGAGAGQVKVLGAHEQYSTTTKAAVYPEFTHKGTKHPFAGRPATFLETNLDQPSDLAKAVNGVFVKFSLQNQLKSVGDCPRWLQLNDHEKELMQYALRELPWTGYIKGAADCGQDGASLETGAAYMVNRQKLSEQMRKDILDDSSSGGINAVPVTFDDAIVLTPVLYGELFPLVEVVNWARGRLIDGSTMSNPSWTWGTAEGTSITPFDTTSFIAGMDSTIYPVVGAVLLGLDFEEDTPVGIGAAITRKFGEKLMETLDYVIALGNGTTQPTGFFNASGLTTVTSSNGVNGPPTLSDYEGLYFGVAKQFRLDKGGDRAVFVANDTTYRRAKSIPRGPNDAQRLGGMTHSDYRWMDRPYKVQNDIGNTRAAYVNLAGYRMYRRRGMTVRVETGGQTLALKNERLIVVRARFGGRLTLAGYCAASSTMQQ